MKLESGESRPFQFLRQQISIEIQPGNAISIPVTDESIEGYLVKYYNEKICVQIMLFYYLNGLNGKGIWVDIPCIHPKHPDCDWRVKEKYDIPW